MLSVVELFGWSCFWQKIIKILRKGEDKKIGINNKAQKKIRRR